MSRLRQYLSRTPEDKQELATIAYLASLELISQSKPMVAENILNELHDQRSNLKLIASENFSSLAVQLAMGNLLTDKYSEGYVNHRFYAGCANVDAVEGEATELAKKVFGSDHAYVQPHSGADANLVAFWSILVQRGQNSEVEKLGKLKLDELSDEEYEQVRQLMMNQKVMGLSLSSGGHLTHGYRHNVSSKMMNAVCYDVSPESGLIDYADLAEQVKKEKPDIFLAGYSAYPRRINFAKMREIADSVGAVFMVDMAHFAGLVAGKVFSGDYDPVPFAHIVTSTTHKTLRGPRGGFVLCKDEYSETINKGCPLILGGPLPHVMAAKAIAFDEASRPEFRDYASRVVENAAELSEGLQKNGLRVLTGGTDNHLVVLNLSDVGLTGRQAESALREAGCTSNRNPIPFDKNGAWYTSGVRLGTPAVSSLGMGKSEMGEIASVIADILKSTKPKTVERTGKPSKAKFETDEAVLGDAMGRVNDLLGRFPLYPELEIESPVYSSAEV
jgi:glycine hydroxymethyltransferase